MKERMTFDQFERDWLRRHKSKVVRPRRVSSWGLIFSILLWSIIAVGAALVSGAHSVPAILFTIPAVVMSPAREILSLFGFTIFELLIFAGAMYRHDSHYAEKGLILAMIGALAANEGSSIYATTQNGGGWLDLVVAIILGLIAPLAAFLAGEMIRIQRQKYKTEKEKAKHEYDGERAALEAVINREFKKYEREYDEANESRLGDLVHGEFHENFMKSDEEKLSPIRRVKLHEVARQVHENGDHNMSVADMMEKYQISQGGTTKVREILRSRNGNDVVE